MKPTLFADDIIVYIEMNLQKIWELIKEFRKVTGCKVNF